MTESRPDPLVDDLRAEFDQGHFMPWEQIIARIEARSSHSDVSADPTLPPANPDLIEVGSWGSYRPLKEANPKEYARLDAIRKAGHSDVSALDVDRLTAIIESRMSAELAWLGDDGVTVTMHGPEFIAAALLHLYRTGDVVSGLAAPSAGAEK